MFKQPTNKRELVEELRCANFEVVTIQEGDPRGVAETVKKLPWREVTVIVLRTK